MTGFLITLSLKLIRERISKDSWVIFFPSEKLFTAGLEGFFCLIFLVRDIYQASGWKRNVGHKNSRQLTARPRTRIHTWMNILIMGVSYDRVHSAMHRTHIYSTHAHMVQGPVLKLGADVCWHEYCAYMGNDTAWHTHTHASSFPPALSRSLSLSLSPRQD